MDKLKKFQKRLKKRHSITFNSYFSVGIIMLLSIGYILQISSGILYNNVQSIAKYLKIVDTDVQRSIYIALGTTLVAYIFYVATTAYQMPTKIQRGLYIDYSKIIPLFIIYVMFLFIFLFSYLAKGIFFFIFFTLPYLSVFFIRTIRFTLGYGNPINLEHSYCSHIIRGTIYRETLREQAHALEKMFCCFIECTKPNITILTEKNRDNFIPLTPIYIPFEHHLYNVDFKKFMKAVNKLNETEQGSIAFEADIFDSERVADYMIYIRRDAQRVDEKRLKKFSEKLSKARLINFIRPLSGDAFKTKKSKTLPLSDARAMLVEYTRHACKSADTQRMRVVRKSYDQLRDLFSEFRKECNAGNPENNSSQEPFDSFHRPFLDLIRADISEIKAHAEELKQKNKDVDFLISHLEGLFTDSAEQEEPKDKSDA